MPTPDHPLILNTGRVRDQWHTMTRTGRSPRLTGHNPEPFVQIHPRDAEQCGITAGDLTEVANHRGRIVVRAEVTDAVAPGQVFVPMHWNDGFASAARVGALLDAAPDPVSGQPELKHGAVRVTRYAPRWYGFALAREPLAVGDCAYFACARGQGHWRYELAGETVPPSWRDWATRLLGPPEHRIELSDPAAGSYRAACVTGKRLQACLFIAAHKALPARSWLASLFALGELGDAERLGVLAGRAPNGAGEAGPLVCSCFAVGRSTLLRAIRTQALVSVEDIGRALSAGTNCGSCVPELKALLASAR
jgi:assimilatory nitrate reductase catalytic subunit